MADSIPLGLAGRLPIGYIQALREGGNADQDLIKAGQEAVRAYREQEVAMAAARTRIEESRISK